MADRKILLKLAANQIGVSSEQDTFDNRLILQKAIYILQASGLNFGYRYSWYIRGPYCPDVTYEAFDMKGSPLVSQYRLGPQTKNKLDRLSNLFSDLKRDDVNDSSARKFERFASILFVLKTGQSKVTDTIEIRERMEKANKLYTQKEVDTTVTILQGHHLV